MAAILLEDKPPVRLGLRKLLTRVSPDMLANETSYCADFCAAFVACGRKELQVRFPNMDLSPAAQRRLSNIARDFCHHHAELLEKGPSVDSDATATWRCMQHLPGRSFDAHNLRNLRNLRTPVECDLLRVHALSLPKQYCFVTQRDPNLATLRAIDPQTGNLEEVWE